MRKTTLHQKNVITVLLFFLLYSKNVHFDKKKKAFKEGWNSPGFCVSVIVSFIILVKRSKCEEKYDCAFYGEILFRYLIFFCCISKPLMFESKLIMVGYTG